MREREERESERERGVITVIDVKRHLFCDIFISETEDTKTVEQVCEPLISISSANSQGSAKPAHLCMLARVFTARLLSPFLHECSCLAPPTTKIYINIFLCWFIEQRNNLSGPFDVTLFSGARGINPCLVLVNPGRPVPT